MSASFLHANDGHAWRSTNPCPEHKLRSPCNRRWRNLGTRYAHSTRILKKKVELFMCKKKRRVLMTLTHAVDSRHLIKSLTTNIAELFLVMNRLRPAMCDGILGQKWSNSRARRDDIRDTFFMHNKIAHYKEKRERERKITIEEYYRESERERERKCGVMCCVSMRLCRCMYAIFQSLALSHLCVDLFFPLKMWTYDVNKNSMHFSVSVTCAPLPLLFIHETYFLLQKKYPFFAFFHLLHALAHSLTKYQDLQPSFGEGGG